MSRNVAFQTVDSAGGQQLGGGQQQLSINGRFAIVLGDPVQPHGNGKHRNPVMAEASYYWTIDGKPLCVEGNRASCGHPTTGQPWLSVPY